MSTNSLDISWIRGDSYPIVFTIKDKETGEPVPLDGATLTFTVNTEKNPPDDSTQVFQLTGTINEAPDVVGEVSFLPLPADTAEIGKYYYDVQMNGNDGSVRTVVKAGFNITMDITKI